MDDYKTLVQEDRRLVILRLLNQSDGYSANVSILQKGLEHLGHRATRDVIATDVAWLSEQGLLSRENVGEVLVATLTERGQDVAKGNATVPGVNRPAPKR